MLIILWSIIDVVERWVHYVIKSSVVKGIFCSNIMGVGPLVEVFGIA